MAHITPGSAVGDQPLADWGLSYIRENTLCKYKGELYIATKASSSRQPTSAKSFGCCARWQTRRSNA